MKVKSLAEEYLFTPSTEMEILTLSILFEDTKTGAWQITDLPCLNTLTDVASVSPNQHLTSCMNGSWSIVTSTLGCSSKVA